MKGSILTLMLVPKLHFGGDIDGNTTQLFDYAWKEWNGLIREYYYPRWQIFYNEIDNALASHKRPKLSKHHPWLQRSSYRKYPIGKKIDKFELDWIKTYCDYPIVENKDVIKMAKLLINKYFVD